MTYPFAEIAFTDAVKAQQEKMGSRKLYEASLDADRDFRLAEAAKDFVESRDHFFMASVSETGWPYVQHRGGPAGFVTVLDESRFAFADYVGNRQYVTLGNLDRNDRAAFIFMDYPNRARLKALGRVRIVSAKDDPELMARVRPTYAKKPPDRAFIVTVEALDWNCPKYITPRFTREEISDGMASLQDKLTALEAENAALRRMLEARD
jgi:hypothetical protein